MLPRGVVHLHAGFAAASTHVALSMVGAGLVSPSDTRLALAAKRPRGTAHCKEKLSDT